MILRALALLFVVQLALVATLYWPKAPAKISREALITTIAQDAISRIQLSNNDGATLVLVRDADEWRLDLGIPADSTKVAGLLSALLTRDPGFPIADSSSAAKRFEVSETAFIRRITLASASSKVTAYLGSTPAMGKIHARLEGEDAVYLLPLSSYDAPVDIDSWLDTRLLSSKTPTLFSLYGVEFTSNDSLWSRSDGQATNQALASAFADVLASLQISGLVDPADGDLASAGESLRVALGDDEGVSLLSVLHSEDSERYYFESERFDEIFSTSAYDAERLIDAAKALIAGDG
ncbi:DUF4340 domain-containing protein [Congregibacter sp.]|uniref:DUF4340 domain-containing protein n=1 Tax=Congregibacter sp. TaxID=2744308 RepID=UPI003F6C2812